jgi:hypothetical protein
MADVDILLGYKDAAWFTANAAIVLEPGQIVFLEQTGTYKLGDGVTALSALSFLGGNSGGVQSVTGDGVDNTDPLNPVLTFPTPSDIGLGNVDNTSDANKPISSATQTALDSKVFSLQLFSTLVNLSASTTYFYAPPAVMTGGTGLSRASVCNKTGVISSISTNFYVGTTIGSNDDCTLSIRIFNATGSVVSTTVLSTTIRFDHASRFNQYDFNGLSISVTKGDSISMRLETGAFGTAPTGVLNTTNISIL